MGVCNPGPGALPAGTRWLPAPAVEGLRVGSLRAGGATAGVLGARALRAGAPRPGALNARALRAGALRARALRVGALSAGALRAGALRAGALPAEALRAEALRAAAALINAPPVVLSRVAATAAVVPDGTALRADPGSALRGAMLKVPSEGLALPEGMKGEAVGRGMATAADGAAGSRRYIAHARDLGVGAPTIAKGTPLTEERLRPSEDCTCP